MMEQEYSISEILLAVDEIYNKIKKEDKSITSKVRTIKKDYSEVPKITLKLIEEAEKTK